MWKTLGKNWGKQFLDLWKSWGKLGENRQFCKELKKDNFFSNFVPNQMER
jgi:hypothetical protein